MSNSIITHKVKKLFKIIDDNEELIDKVRIKSFKIVFDVSELQLDELAKILKELNDNNIDYAIARESEKCELHIFI